MNNNNNSVSGGFNFSNKSESGNQDLRFNFNNNQYNCGEFNFNTNNQSDNGNHFGGRFVTVIELEPPMFFFVIVVIRNVLVRKHQPKMYVNTILIEL